MKWNFHRLRIRALQHLTRTVKPSLPLSYLVKSLGFEDAREAGRFIVSCGGVLGEAPERSASPQPPPPPSSSSSSSSSLLSGGSGGGEVESEKEKEFFLDCKASAIEMVREVTEEEVSFKGAAFADYLKAAVIAGGAPLPKN